MIAVDTDVVSELMKVRTDPQVVQWASQLHEAEISLPSVVAAEIFHGLERLPAGTRRRSLESLLDAFFLRLGERAILPFDGRAAVEFGAIMVDGSRVGRPIGHMDGLIAATCLSHGVGLATRNTSDFDGLGLRLIDPWEPCG